MGTASDLTLYGTIASRTFTARWMLGELDLDYAFETVDIRKGDQKRPEYLALNPMGKVPTLRDGGVVVTESVAICLYLADRYGYGTLAPRVEDPARGTYLRWAVFAGTVLEPAIGYAAPETRPPPSRSAGATSTPRSGRARARARARGRTFSASASAPPTSRWARWCRSRC